MKKRIVLAPNEDGFGTSAWAVGLAQKLARQEEVAEVRIVVATDQRYHFHQPMYADLPQVTVTLLPMSRSPIQVAKWEGEVDVPRTIAGAILPYTAVAQEYAQLLHQHTLLQDVDLVIDLGVPALVRAARAQNLRTITLFDHAWSLTLAHIAGELLPPEGRAQVAAMAADEALTDEVLLFADPIAPPPVHAYWQQVLARPLTTIPGVLGGPARTLAYAGLAGQNAGAAREVARQICGLGEEPTVFISGGGTAVWRSILGRLLDSYLANPPPYQVVLYHPAEAEKRGVVMRETAVSFPTCTVPITRGQLGPLIFIGSLPGETHHILFAAFDLVVTRAGGGTVSDAIAHRVPLLLVEEPGMWQVEQIRQACFRLGLAESVTLADFQSKGRAIMENAQGRLRSLAAQKQAMATIPQHIEAWLVARLLQ